MIVGVLSEKKTTQKKFEGIPIVGSFSEFEAVLTKYNPEEILLATQKASESITTEIIHITQINHMKFRFIPDELGLDLASVEVSTLKNMPLITLLNTKLYGWGLVVKIILDFWFALVALLLLAPLFLFVMFKIWISDKQAPIFYASTRVGKNGKPFVCWKFRTMEVDAEKKKKQLLKKNQRKGGVLFKLENDPRVTKFGLFLRKTSIDELPQLLNVLKGEMSFIGPRPHLQEEVEQYPKKDRQILSLRPGITGFSQINGRSSLSFEEEMKYEMFYLKNWSLWLDLIIFVKSIFVVLKKENVS